MGPLKGLAERLLVCLFACFLASRSPSIGDGHVKWLIPRRRHPRANRVLSIATFRIMAIQPTCSNTSTNNYRVDSLVTQVAKNLLPLLRLGDLERCAFNIQALLGSLVR